MDAFWTVPTYVFGASYEDADEWMTILRREGQFPPSNTMAAFVDGRIASTLGVHPWNVRVNGIAIPTACVTAVGTIPEFRRQGYQRQVMTRSLEWHRDSGQPIAMLWASFGAIYQRYGYGLASAHTAYKVDPRYIALRDSAPAAQQGYTVRIEDWKTHRPVVERIYQAYAEPRTLAIERDGLRWDAIFYWDFERRKDAWTHLAIAYDEAQQPQGYLIYSSKEDPVQFRPGPDQKMEVKQFIPLTLGAWRAMWDYVRSHDLVREADVDFIPEDDPAQDMLLEPRELQRRTGDGMWLRMVDVAQALEARGWDEDGAITIAVRDELCAWNDGTYRLAIEGGHASVARTSDAADLTLPVAALSSLYSGFRSATELHRAGRVEGDRDALRRADALFRTAYRPHVLDGF